MFRQLSNYLPHFRWVSFPLAEIFCKSVTPLVEFFILSEFE